MTEPLRIVAIRLSAEASYTTRWIETNGQPDDTYPVMLGLTRSVNKFEEHELSERGFVVLADPPWGRQWVMALTTVDYIRQHVKDLEDKFDAAVESAAVTAEFADAEDRRVKELANEINELLRTANAEEKK